VVEGACFEAGFSAGLVFDAELGFVVLDEARIDPVFVFEVFTGFCYKNVEWSASDGGQPAVFVEFSVSVVGVLSASKKWEPHAAASAGAAIIVW